MTLTALRKNIAALPKPLPGFRHQVPVRDRELLASMLAQAYDVAYSISRDAGGATVTVYQRALCCADPIARDMIALADGFSLGEVATFRLRHRRMRKVFTGPFFARTYRGTHYA